MLFLQTFVRALVWFPNHFTMGQNDASRETSETVKAKSTFGMFGFNQKWQN